MTPIEAIESRHSVRKYKQEALSEDIVATLQKKITEVNAAGNLHVQLITDEPKAFKGIMAYGVFSGVTSYLVMCGKKADDLDERVGYYGEQLVLLAQQLGLNSCWVGLNYHKVPGTYVLNEGEKVACYIALGYGETQGTDHKRKSVDQLSNTGVDDTPEWFIKGVKAARLAPTAVNQQKFFLEYIPPRDGGKARVKAHRKFSMVGYTRMDMGIVKLHFEIGAGVENFDWEE